MAISTNSIIHYTKTLENLIGILKEGFYLKYCNERFACQSKFIPNAYPMVCFCDIPLSEVKNHLKSYGYYGVGLTKNWAIKEGLNPVLYVEKTSLLSKVFYEQATKLVNLKNNSKTILDTTIDDSWRQEFITLCSFIKNYEGEIELNGIKNPNYRFYDEREWRFVPDTTQLQGNPNFIFYDNYKDNKAVYNTKIKEVKLLFKPEDIAYLIVEKPDDIHKMLDFIDQHFRKELTIAEKEILMTKIITTEQIIKDF